MHEQPLVQRTPFPHCRKTSCIPLTQNIIFNTMWYTRDDRTSRVRPGKTTVRFNIRNVHIARTVSLAVHWVF